MFAKLLKHEFKSNAALFTVLTLCSIGISLLGYGLFSLLIYLTEQNSGDSVGFIAGLTTGMMLGVTIIFAVMAYKFTVNIMLLVQFYKHLFSDEGYLTFTLPVTTHQILLSSILNIVIWTLISTVVTAADILILIAPIYRLTNLDMFGFFRDTFDILYINLGTGYQIAQIYSGISTGLYGLIIPLVAITIGCVIAKKHKILASIGIYFGLTTVLSAISAVVNLVTMVSDVAISTQTDTASYILSTVGPATLYLGLAVGGYFLMHYLLDKKLNLA